jgi:glyoxylase-like metal-dependent hydrolase (beta-lactamase superfamily II)
MSEPKTVAREIREVTPGVHHIQIQDDRIKHNSDAHAVVHDGRVVLIDPVPVDPQALARLGKVEAILIDAPSHQRSAWSLRRDLKVKVHAPEGATKLDEAPDATFKDGARLPGGLVAIHAPGPSAHHYALHLDRGPGVIFCGDLMMNEPQGLVFLPDKYQDDPVRSRQSARRLLDFRFEVICFGHGAPIVKGARQAIEALLKGEGGKG